MGTAVKAIPDGITTYPARLDALSIARRLKLLVIAVASLTLAGPLLSRTADAVITYACWALMMIAGGVAALQRARLSADRVHSRWLLFGLSLLFGGLAYVAAALDNQFTSLTFLQPLVIWAGVAGSAFGLLSVTVSFRGLPRSIFTFDLLQTALYSTLAYYINAGSNPWANDLQSHITISFALAVSKFLVAALAPFSATTTEERSFFRIAAVYFGLSCVVRFWGGQVGMIWMHDNGSLYDLPSIALSACLAVYLIDLAFRAKQRLPRDRELGRPRLLMRNLMPSLLALTSLLIALYFFRHAPAAGLAAVLTAILLYLARTLLLQTHMAQDAAALQQRNEQLEDLTQRDALTGAGNRRSMTACFERSCRLAPLTDADEADLSMALLLVDLDFFKQANDCFGHLHGDKILTSVTSVLSAASDLVKGSHVARFGGDEFALLLPRVEAAEAVVIAETIRASIRDLALPAGKHTISVSIGGALTNGADPLDDVIHRADKALYRAKLGGRNRAAFDGDVLAPPIRMAELLQFPRA